MAPSKDFVKDQLSKFTISDSALKAIFDLVEFAYSEGYQEAEQELTVDEEKVGVDYAMEAFADAQSIEEFKSKYQEITNRSLNFMPTLGLK